MPPAANTRAKPNPTAGSTPNENAWMSTLSRTFRAAPASSPSFIVSPTRKNTKDTPSRFITGEGMQELTNADEAVSHTVPGRYAVLL